MLRSFSIGVALITLFGCSTVTKVQKASDSNLTSVAGITSESETDSSAVGPLAEATSAFQNAEAAQDDRIKLAYYLAAAEGSYVYALNEGAEEASRERAIYNAACAEAAVIIHRLAGSDVPFESISAGGKTYRLILRDTDSGGLLQQEYVIASNKLIAQNLKKDVKQSGLGGTLVGYSSKDRPRFENDPNVSPQGRAIGITSLLLFKDSGEVRLEVHDPFKQDIISIGDRRHRLAADFSGPIELQLQQVSKSSIKKVGKKGYFEPEKQEWLRGLFFMEPYRIEKIPVILIHGLYSAPITWLDLYLEFIADKQLRENFQFWIYRYPTGYPIGQNARDFRVAFSECMMRYDPDGKNRALQNTVLVGHSMGGLISSAVVRDSGDILWNLLSNHSIDTLDLDEEVRVELEPIAFFDSLPQVSRVVFMATPHRGSKLAKGFAAKFASALVHSPGNFFKTTDSQPDENFTDFAIEVGSQKQTSVDALKPDAWQLTTLLDLPMSQRVTYHSIIGNKSNKSLTKSGDGVVP